jgi:hypothetical protein
MGEGVLEGIGMVRKEARLIEKLRRLELGETAVQEVLEGVQGPLAAVRWVETLPLGLVHRHLEEREDGGERRAERFVESQHFPDHFLAPAPEVIAGVDVAIACEQV